MRCLALTDLPNGIQAGREFDCSEAEFSVLESVGSARQADEPSAKKSPLPKAKAYNRRDMVAASHVAADPPTSTTPDPTEE